MSGKLTNKVAIVTGGATGFGAGIVAKFTQEGALVVLVDLHQENGEKVAAAQRPGSTIFIQGDVSSEQDWERVRSTALDHFHRIDIVVNNAGVVNKAIVRLLCYLLSSCPCSSILINCHRCTNWSPTI